MEATKKKEKRKPLDPKTVLSKYLSYVLRHGAKEEKIPIRSDGYVKVEDLLKKQKLKSKKTTFEMIKDVVDTNSKQRFTLREEDGVWWIKANQGHTIQVN